MRYIVSNEKTIAHWFMWVLILVSTCRISFTLKGVIIILQCTYASDNTFKKNNAFNVSNC